jgi:hypothetical protein
MTITFSQLFLRRSVTDENQMQWRDDRHSSQNKLYYIQIKQ